MICKKCDYCRTEVEVVRVPLVNGGIYTDGHNTKEDYDTYELCGTCITRILMVIKQEKQFREAIVKAIR